MSVKWRNVKVVFRYSDGIDKPILEPQFPMFFDLSSDPKEQFNLFDYKMDMGWMAIPAYKAIGDFQKSVAQYPNIKPGQEFEGYKEEGAKEEGAKEEGGIEQRRRLRRGRLEDSVFLAMTSTHISGVQGTRVPCRGSGPRIWGMQQRVTEKALFLVPPLPCVQTERQLDARASLSGCISSPACDKL